DDRKEKDKLQIFHKESMVTPTIDLHEPLRNELEHFIHCVQTSESPLTGAAFGCRVTEMCDTIVRNMNS
ncbi:MAG: hypothetical protein AAB906_00810, partial [Patescibacteria group bacterium]